jgi:hypothetical protein
MNCQSCSFRKLKKKKTKTKQNTQTFLPTLHLYKVLVGTIQFLLGCVYGTYYIHPNPKVTFGHIVNAVGTRVVLQFFFPQSALCPAFFSLVTFCTHKTLGLVHDKFCLMLYNR